MVVRYRNWALVLLGVLLVAAAVRQFLPGLDRTADGIDRRALWDGRADVRFRALSTPEMVPVDKADFISPSDYVLGVSVAGQSRAYPSSYIGFHHVVNDKVFTASHDAKWFAVTYCDMCGTGIMFDSMLDGKARELEFYGLYNGTIALCDRETQSVFLPNTGAFVTGPLLGKELKMESLLDTTWAQWKRLHPDTLVMSPDETDRQYYVENAKHLRSMDSFPMEFFAPTVTRADKRMAPFDRILGVTLRKHDKDGKASVFHRAYSFTALRASNGLINDTIGDEPISVFFDPGTIAAVVVSQKVMGQVHHFETRRMPDGHVAFYDTESGTRWTIEGHGDAGPLSGKDLTRLDAYLGEWYAWAAYFPETSIYGHSDPPQPAKPQF